MLSSYIFFSASKALWLAFILLRDDSYAIFVAFASVNLESASASCLLVLDCLSFKAFFWSASSLSALFNLDLAELIFLSASANLLLVFSRILLLILSILFWLSLTSTVSSTPPTTETLATPSCLSIYGSTTSFENVVRSLIFFPS